MPVKRQHFRVSKFKYGFHVEDGIITVGGCPKKYIGMNIHDAIFEIKKDQFMLVEKVCDFKDAEIT